jgi:hypothetical protein
MLADMKLSAGNRDTALAAVRAYRDDDRRLHELAAADLLLKMKEILSPEEYKKVKEAADKFREERGGARRLAADAIVERLMSFDKNGDGLLSRDELPERMQDLLAKGDTNKDGFLDKEEIKKLAADLAKEEASSAAGPSDRFPPGPGGRGGRGGRGGPAAANGFPPDVVERAVKDLKLSGKTQEAVGAAVKAHRENVRKLTELARSDLLLTMTDVLGDEDFKQFKAAVERLPGPGDRPGGKPPFGPPGPGRPGRP